MDRTPDVRLLDGCEPPVRSAPTARVALLRTLLVAGAMAAMVVAATVASAASAPADVELTRLLRGMAAIKGLLALGAAVMVGWRLGLPIATPVAGAYIVGVGAMCVATVLIWQMAFVAAGAGLFHAASLGMIVLAMREGIGPPRLLDRRRGRAAEAAGGTRSGANTALERNAGRGHRIAPGRPDGFQNREHVRG